MPKEPQATNRLKSHDNIWAGRKRSWPVAPASLALRSLVASIRAYGAIDCYHQFGITLRLPHVTHYDHSSILMRWHLWAPFLPKTKDESQLPHST